jgi:hypothetical protein
VLQLSPYLYYETLTAEFQYILNVLIVVFNSSFQIKW